MRYPARHLAQILSATFVIAGLCCLCACGDSSNDTNQTNADNGSVTRVSELISAEMGGTISAPFGVSLTIPPNALAEDTTITIQKGDQSLPQNVQAFSDVYTFEPEGLTFETDSDGNQLRATVWMTYPPQGAQTPDVLWTVPGDSNTFAPSIGAMFAPSIGAMFAPSIGAMFSARGADIEHFSRGLVGLDDSAIARCDVLTEVAAATACSTDEKCIEVAVGNSFCASYDNNATPGGTCTDSTNCVQNEYCAGGTCYAVCDPMETAPCPSGQSCAIPQLPSAADPSVLENASFGLCT